MYQKRITTSESPRVEVTACQGNLAVAAWDTAEVLIEVDSEEVDLGVELTPQLFSQ